MHKAIKFLRVKIDWVSFKIGSFLLRSSFRFGLNSFISKLGRFLVKRFIRLSKKDINYYRLGGKKITNLSYMSSDFKDILYNIDNQKRETAATIKILNSLHLLSFLCNDTYTWVAIKIPLNMCGSSLQGDIDILVAMVEFPGNKKIYRAFEAKTTKISNEAVIKSLKFKKFHKTLEQLRKIVNAGSQQTFLLEVYILEADYSFKFKRLPNSILSLIESKVSTIKREKFGYNCMFIEQQRGFDEEKTGIFHMPVCLKGAEIKELDAPMKDIVNFIEKFWDNRKGPSTGEQFIFFCENCKKLSILNAKGPDYICEHCNKQIL